MMIILTLLPVFVRIGFWAGGLVSTVVAVNG